MRKLAMLILFCALHYRETAYSRMIFRAHTPVSTLQAYARNIRQSLLSKSLVLFADHPKHQSASADGVVGWPCLDALLICDAIGALESLR